MKRLYFTAQTIETGGDVHDPEDKFSSREPAYIDVSFGLYAYRNEKDVPTFFKESLEVSSPEVFNSNVVHLLVVRYSTGDSFGHTNGDFCCVEFFADFEKAIEAGELIKKDEENRKNLDDKSKYEHKYEYKYTPPMGYRPWEGYFEKFESVQVASMKVV